MEKINYKDMTESIIKDGRIFKGKFKINGD